MNGTGSILTSCILYNGLQVAKNNFLLERAMLGKIRLVAQIKNVSLTTISVSRDPYAFFFQLLRNSSKRISINTSC